MLRPVICLTLLSIILARGQAGPAGAGEYRYRFAAGETVEYHFQESIEGFIRLPGGRKMPLDLGNTSLLVFNVRRVEECGRYLVEARVVRSDFSLAAGGEGPPTRRGSGGQSSGETLSFLLSPAGEISFPAESLPGAFPGRVLSRFFPPLPPAGAGDGTSWRVEMLEDIPLPGLSGSGSGKGQGKAVFEEIYRLRKGENGARFTLERRNSGADGPGRDAGGGTIVFREGVVQSGQFRFPPGLSDGLPGRAEGSGTNVLLDGWREVEVRLVGR